jgi:hypothetical protein
MFLFSVSQIMDWETREGMPGLALHPHGFVVFATNNYGDGYCFDLSTISPEGDCPVVLMSHELSYDRMSIAEVHALRKFVAASLYEFLERFVDGKLETRPNY